MNSGCSSYWNSFLLKYPSNADDSAVRPLGYRAIRSTADDTITCTTAVQLRKARINMPVFLSVLFSHLLAAVRKGCCTRERRTGCMAVKRLPLRVQLPPFPFVASVMNCFLLYFWILLCERALFWMGRSFTLLNVCQHWMRADKCINLSNVKRIYFCIWF